MGSGSLGGLPGSGAGATPPGAAGTTAGGLVSSPPGRASDRRITELMGSRSLGRLRGMLTPESVADHDGRGVHREQQRDEDQDAARGDNLVMPVGLPGVIVDFDRQRGVAVERPL